ncbi:penicillin-binding family protein [Listeria floridensis FSL S10-1187]|uniref:Penicillin-binding family protein n=1 Tax=Listeria floridensis FSL S10-1187 TaxID=1265817 RepID=A0ABP3B102_9LIST|nr:penicillin-binding family protein [Listeria floridensis FSL S10-1187]
MKQPFYKQRSWQIAIAAIILLLIAAIALFFIWGNQSADKKARQIAEDFTTDLKKADYKKLSETMSVKSLKSYNFTAEKVADKYETVYGGIGVKDISVKNLEVKPGKNSRTYDLSYELSMRTSLGKLRTQKYAATISNDKDNWKVDWNPGLIFPGMVADDKVRLTTDEAKRGDILDRNGKKLATMGNFEEAGIVPEQLSDGSAKDQELKAISEKLGVSLDEIHAALDQKWVKADSFVPLKTILDAPA